MSVFDFPRNFPFSYPSVYDNNLTHQKKEGYYETFDLRKIKNDTKYFVTLIARNNTISGHIFINWGFESESLKISKSEGSFGFYPKSKKVVDIFHDVGSVEEELERNYPDNYQLMPLKKLVILVDKPIYDITISTKQKWRLNPPDYFLLAYNCMSFVIEISTLLNLKTPKTTDNQDDIIRFPWYFIDDLIRLNR